VSLETKFQKGKEKQGTRQAGLCIELAKVLNSHEKEKRSVASTEAFIGACKVKEKPDKQPKELLANCTTRRGNSHTETLRKMVFSQFGLELNG
jgi:hypothetical protein